MLYKDDVDSLKYKEVESSIIKTFLKVSCVRDV